MDSNWKTFDGFSRYRILDWGGVYDKDEQRWLRPRPNEDGYYCITLRSDDGKRKSFKLHRLVAILFIPNPENKPEVNHKFGNKADNHYLKLEWATHAENIQHAWDTGLLRSTSERSRKLSSSHTGKRRGATNHKSLPVRLANTGEVFESGCIAAAAYGLDQGRISRCCNERHGYRSAGKHPRTGEPLVWKFHKEVPHDRLPR